MDFYVDGVFQGTDVTNNGGFAYLTVQSPLWHVGDHVILARYDRFNTPGNPATDTANLAVRKEVTGVTARDGYFEAELRDDDGAALTGFVIRFHVVRDVTDQHVDEDVCIAFTDATGTARCASPSGVGVVLAHDATQYTATFDGTSDYLGASDTANL